MRFICCVVFALAMAAPNAAPAQPEPASAIEDVVPEQPGILQGSWFAAAELSIVWPRVKQYPSDLFSGVPLSTTISPEFSGGYRFASGRALHFDYRFLMSSGSQDYFPRWHATGLGPNDEILNAFLPYRGHATWNMHTFDLDFTFREPFWESLPFIRSRWEIGARTALLSSEVREPKVFDDRFGFSVARATEWFGDEKLASTYQGYGPHFDYKLAIAVDSWGLEFFAISDVALLFGTRTARYSPIDPQPWRNGREVGPGWDMFTGTEVLVDARPITDHRFACTGWNWRGDLGVRVTRPWRGGVVSIAAGYRRDVWTFGGRSNGGSGFFGGAIKVPDLDLEMKGAFIRIEVRM